MSELPEVGTGDVLVLAGDICTVVDNNNRGKGRGRDLMILLSLLGLWGKAHEESSSRKHNQKAPEDMSFIREKTYTLPITLARGLRIRARTRRGKKRRRKEKPGGVPTHTRRSFSFQGTLRPQVNCRSGPRNKSRHHEVDVSSGAQLFSLSAWEEKHQERQNLYP